MDKDVSKSSNGFIFHYIKTVINVEQTAFNSIQTYQKQNFRVSFGCFSLVSPFTQQIGALCRVSAKITRIRILQECFLSDVALLALHVNPLNTSIDTMKEHYWYYLAVSNVNICFAIPKVIAWILDRLRETKLYLAQKCMMSKYFFLVCVRRVRLYQIHYLQRGRAHRILK